MTDKWIVDIKGGANSEGFEISVVRQSNKHGIRSYGWFGPDKVMIASDSRESLIPIVWDRMIVLANEVAEDLNRQ